MYKFFVLCSSQIYPLELILKNSPVLIIFCAFFLGSSDGLLRFWGNEEGNDWPPVFPFFFFFVLLTSHESELQNLS